MLGFAHIATRPIAGTPASLGGNLSLTATNLVTGAPVVGSPAMTQAHVLVATGIVTGAPVVGSPALTLNTGLALVAVNLVTGAPVVGSPALTQAHVLTATGIVTGAPVVGSPALSFNVVGAWQGRIATPQESANGGYLAPSIRTGSLG